MNLLVNKKARYSYEVLDTFEAGMQLLGWEVKSLRAKHGSIKESYISGEKELFLISAHIPVYQATQPTLEHADPYRKRKLLLHAAEIAKIQSKIKEQGLTVVPLRIYTKGDLIKIEIAIARGKKLYDKRKSMKDRTSKRDAERAIKNY